MEQKTHAHMDEYLVKTRDAEQLFLLLSAQEFLYIYSKWKYRQQYTEHRGGHHSEQY